MLCRGEAEKGWASDRLWSCPRRQAICLFIQDTQAALSIPCMELEARNQETLTTMTSLTITIPHPPKECRPNGQHGHWAKKSEAKKAYRGVSHLACIAALRGRMPERWRQAKVQVIAYTKTAQHQDPDNLIASLKAAFDGIADAQIVANDKGLWPERPVILKDPVNPRIELTITEEP